jgi:dTDP-4-amino-4,6-dideoxygalactose transaminase
VLAGDAAVVERARELRNIGQRAKGEHVVAGFNERLDGLRAAFLRAKLPYLERWIAQRRRHATAYRRRLRNSVGLLEECPGAGSVHHL